MLLGDHLGYVFERENLIGSSQGVVVLEVDFVLACGHPWWEASTSNPICCRANTIASRASSPLSTGERSK